MDALLTKLFDGIGPAVLAWYRDRTSVAQKWSRLDMLVTKIRSVVEVSEKTEIQNESLRKWQQTFKDAATQGDEVLRKLQDQVNSSSSSSSSSGISSIKRLFSGTEDEKKLKSTIELLEQSSAEVKDFLKILKLELSEVVKQRRILDLQRAPEALQQKIEINKVGRDHEACLGNPSPLRPVLINFTDHCKIQSKSSSLKMLSKGPKFVNRQLEEPKMLESKEDRELHESTGRAPELHKTAKRPKKVGSKPEKSLELAEPTKPSLPSYSPCLPSLVLRKSESCRIAGICRGFEPKAMEFVTSKPDFSSDKDKDLMSEECFEDGNIITGSKDPRFLDIFGGEEESIGLLVEAKLVTPNLAHSLSSRTIEDLAAVEDLVAKIQSALDMAMKHGAVEDGWFGQLIAKLREAMKEGNSVASAIKSNNYCVHDQISDEVGEIVKAVRLRLESVHDDLEDFTNLAEVEELVRELTPAGPSIAHT